MEKEEFKRKIQERAKQEFDIQINDLSLEIIVHDEERLEMFKEMGWI